MENTKRVRNSPTLLTILRTSHFFSELDVEKLRTDRWPKPLQHQDVISRSAQLQVPPRLRTGSQAGAVLRQHTGIQVQLGLHILRGESQVPGHYRRVGGRRSLHRPATQQSECATGPIIVALVYVRLPRRGQLGGVFLNKTMGNYL